MAETDVLQLAVCQQSGHAYAACGDGRLLAFHLASGRRVAEWRPTGRGASRGCRCVAAAGRLVYAGFADGAA